jgi:hypothetical protein
VLLCGSPILAAFRVSYLLCLIVIAVTGLGIAFTLTSLALILWQRIRRTEGWTEARRHLRGRRLIASLTALAAGIGALVVLESRVGAAGWLTAMALCLAALVPPRLGPPVEFRLILREKSRAGGRTRLEATTVEELARSFLTILILEGSPPLCASRDTACRSPPRPRRWPSLLDRPSRGGIVRGCSRPAASSSPRSTSASSLSAGADPTRPTRGPRRATGSGFSR